MNKSANTRTKYKGKIIRRRGASWQVDLGTKGGKRVQRSFKTKDDAKLAIDEFNEQKRLSGIDLQNRRVAVYDLTDSQRMDVVTALGKLDGCATLNDAVDFYLLHTSPEGGSRTVSEVLEEYLLAKERANCAFRRDRTAIPGLNRTPVGA